MEPVAYPVFMLANGVDMKEEHSQLVLSRTLYDLILNAGAMAKEDKRDHRITLIIIAAPAGAMVDVTTEVSTCQDGECSPS